MEPVEPDVVETYSSNLHPNEDEIQLLRLKLDEAQCKNRVIQEEMNNLKSKLVVEKREQAVGSSDPEDEEETDEAKAKHLADQEDHISVLQRKYEHAKRIIHELSRHEQLLAGQLRERDQEYNSHLRLLKSRVQQLENELATTQKFAGIPVQLPYEGLPGGDGNLSSPELLKQPPIIPDPVLKNTQLVSEEISEDMASAKQELDEAVPIHTLLDVSANRSKAELAHKGLLSQRQRPSSEALRATVLRKSVSTLSSEGDSGFPADSCEDTRENTPDSDSSYMGSVVTVTSTSRTFNTRPPPPLDGATTAPPPPVAMNPTPMAGGLPSKSFLSEMQNVHRKKNMEAAAAAAASTNIDSPPSANTTTTLADQLRSRLEERRKSKEEEQQQQPQTASTSGPPFLATSSQPHMASVVAASNSASTQSAAYVPESIAADIQKAVKMANDTTMHENRS